MDLSSLADSAFADLTGVSPRQRRLPDLQTRSLSGDERGASLRRQWHVHHHLALSDKGNTKSLGRSRGNSGKTSRQVKSSQVKSSRVESSQVKSRQSSQVKSSQVSQVKSSQVKSSRVESSRVKSSQVTSSQVKSSRVESSRVESSQVKSRQVKSSQVKFIISYR